MNSEKYLNMLTELYRCANLSDAYDHEDWPYFLPVDACGTHCTAIEKIVLTMLSPEDYQAWLDSI